MNEYYGGIIDERIYKSERDGEILEALFFHIIQHIEDRHCRVPISAIFTLRRLIRHLHPIRKIQLFNAVVMCIGSKKKWYLYDILTNENKISKKTIIKENIIEIIANGLDISKL